MMLMVTSVPLSLVVGVVFIGALGLILALDRVRRTSPAQMRLEDYVQASSSPVSIQTEASRRREAGTPLDRLLSYAAVTAPKKLRATTATDLTRARVTLSPNVFL